jgi:hypothetical protein
MRYPSRINGDIECPFTTREMVDAGFGHQSLGAASIAFGFNWSRSATLSPGERRFGAIARGKRFAEKDHLEPIPAGRTSAERYLGVFTREMMQMRQVREETSRIREDNVQLRKELTAACEELRATTELLHKSLRLGFAEEDQIQRLSSGRRRSADVLIFDPKRKVN